MGGSPQRVPRRPAGSCQKGLYSNGIKQRRRLYCHSLMNAPIELLTEPPSQPARADSPNRTARRPLRPTRSPVGFWHAPAVIAENNFIYKSLSNWAFNVAVGCSHACRFCYVPSVATIKQAAKLAEYGVEDPDVEWGDYVLLRPWDEDKFLASLRSAENTPRSQLKPDGNRADRKSTPSE